ncbi:hypothetical protein [Vibrio alfacsensis]|uniref:hypothetical protein n=1 Tax=Vibrio alfacsensis TaxID=1074311 RepID=UPI001BEEFFED|nr:hypothetical protein [Vibrio alfacsensis]BCN26302.1 hypothetical protein VYA_34940 [Vibrio alfacsensis]
MHISIPLSTFVTGAQTNIRYDNSTHKPTFKVIDMNVLYFPNNNRLPSYHDFKDVKSIAFSEIIKTTIQIHGQIPNEDAVLKQVNTQAEAFKNDFLNSQLDKAEFIERIIQSVMNRINSEALGLSDF